MGQVLALRQETSGTLFDLPPLSQAMREVADDLSLAQARHELHRAQDFGNEAELARWAERWGPGFVDRSNLDNVIAGLERDLAAAEAEAEEPVDTARVDDELDEVEACIRAALEALAPDGVDDSDAVDQLKDALKHLDKAGVELDKL